MDVVEVTDDVVSDARLDTGTKDGVVVNGDIVGDSHSDVAVEDDAADVEDEDAFCVPDCTGRECGPDPFCGQSCGTCNDGYLCQDGVCAEDTGWKSDDYTVNCSNGMCLIPAGTFRMGCNESVDTQCDSVEKPYHEVNLSAYHIDKTEVTQGEYKKCVDAGTCATPERNWDPSGVPDRPVVYVSWNDATAYCIWAGKRLPTEAEWEKAARGTDGRKYPWGNETTICDHAVTFGCSDGPQDVCSKSPSGDSPYGLCDVAGNVWEWVSDWYGSDYYVNSPMSDPAGPVGGSDRVRRGGSFFASAAALRPSSRYYSDQLHVHDSLGFRCARSQ